MSNKITIELCTDDRARLDMIVSRLEALATQTQFIIEKAFDKPIQTSADEDIRKALEEAIKPKAEIKAAFEEAVEATKNATEEAEKTTLPITPKVEETPKATEEPKPTPTRTVTRAELGTKVREMMTKGFKDQTKAIVKEYAPTVPGVPEDKVTECYDRLVALEG